MKILQENKNDLLRRKEIIFSVEAGTNPGLEGVKKMLMENTKSAEENIAIKFVKNNFGAHSFIAEAFIYDSKDDKDKIEPKPKKKKGANN